MTEQFDILVCGGGIAGLTAASAFGTMGFSVLCIDPVPPITSAGTDGADMRSTAFLQPARDVLERAGIWPALDAHATPLQLMRLADAGGDVNEIRHIADFSASEISEHPFGWNLPNWLLKREMVARVETLTNVQFKTGVTAKRLTTRDAETRVLLSDGAHISARLVIAADGRNSPTRTALGINVHTIRYPQKALAFTVRHRNPHLNISTELHRTGGPFTLVPLPQKAGENHSSVVWMETSAEAERLSRLPEDLFNNEASERSCHVLGPLELTSRRTVYPIISQRAARITAPRTALIAEAAHVVPPIGAQGLNMSLADIACLSQLARDMPDGIGSSDFLDAYSRARLPDITARIAGIDILNRAALAHSPNLRALRLKGLQTLHSVVPLRRMVMRLGLGV